MSTDKLNYWIRRQLFGSKTCDKIELRHLPADGKTGQEVTTLEMKPNVKPDDVQDIIQEVYDALQADAEVIGGVQKYRLLPYFDGAKEPSGRFLVRVEAGNSSDDEEGFDSEPANQKGLLSQLMRHMEARERLMLTSMNNIMNAQTRILGRQAEQLENYAGKHIELVQTVEELHSEKHLREMETKEFSASQDRKTEMMKQFQLLIPVAANKLLGGKTNGKNVMDEVVNPHQMMLKRLMDSITQDQLDKLEDIFDAEMMKDFASIYESQRDLDDNGVATTPEAKKKGKEGIVTAKNFFKKLKAKVVSDGNVLNQLQEVFTMQQLSVVKELNETL